MWASRRIIHVARVCLGTQLEGGDGWARDVDGVDFDVELGLPLFVELRAHESRSEDDADDGDGEGDAADEAPANR